MVSVLPTFITAQPRPVHAWPPVPDLYRGRTVFCIPFVDARVLIRHFHTNSVLNRGVILVLIINIFGKTVVLFLCLHRNQPRLRIFLVALNLLELPGPGGPDDPVLALISTIGCRGEAAGVLVLVAKVHPGPASQAEQTNKNKDPM